MNDVARTILEQLGGTTFVAMTGARNFSSLDNALLFTLPGTGGFTKNGINRVAILLNASDLYDLTFSRVRGSSVTKVDERNDIYAEDLRRVFTEVTGLDTSL